MWEPEGSLSFELLGRFGKAYEADPNNALFESIIAQNGLRSTALRRRAVQNDPLVFSLELPKVKATNQKKSGRCWAFAGLNLLRGTVAKSLGADPETFELSQNYTTFYDKLEKANSFYEAVLESAGRRTDDRALLFLLEQGMAQGGTWQFLRELVKKYGVVPKEIMPETKDSEEADPYTQVLSTKLRRDAAVLRRMLRGGASAVEARAEKEKMLEGVFGILCKVLGRPPEMFTYEYYDKEKNYRRLEPLTPAAFFEKTIGADLDEYVVVGDNPAEGREYGKLYCEREYIANVWKRSRQVYLNLGIDELKALTLRSLQNGEPVVFACNVTQDSNRELELFDSGLYDYEKLLGVELSMPKAEMLEYRDISAEHMMLFTGANVVDGKVNRWKVENSWGDEKCNKGFFVMSDGFFDRYVLQCVAKKKDLLPEQSAMLEQAPIVFEPWDPMH